MGLTNIPGAAMLTLDTYGSSWQIRLQRDDDDCAITGSKTRKQRDEELMKSAIDLSDSDDDEMAPPSITLPTTASTTTTMATAATAPAMSARPSSIRQPSAALIASTAALIAAPRTPLTFR